MSASTGVAPQRTIELTEAKKLKGVVTTLVFASTSQPDSASHNASVPEAQPTLAPQPRYRADSSSNESSSGPPMKCCDVSTRWTAASMSSLMAAYCRFRSSMGTGACVAGHAGSGGFLHRS